MDNSVPDAVELEERLNLLEEELAARTADLRDLIMMGAVVTSLHDINAVLSVAMEMALRLVNGEVGAIMLEENGKLDNSISLGVGYDFIKTLMFGEDTDLASYCLSSGESVVLHDLGVKTEDGITIQSIIAVPIMTADKKLGVLMIFNKDDGTEFTQANREILELLMRFLAVAVQNYRLLIDRLKQQKVDQQMSIAKQVQETILPKNVNAVEGAEIGAVYFPAQEVGGDFYDVITIDDNTLVVVIGDVSNKGVPAALIMSAAAGIIKTMLADRPDIPMAELADTTNNLLAQGIIRDRDMFVTLFFCKFDFAGKELSFCNGGHLPGLFWNDADQQITELADGGPIVGQFVGVHYKEGRLPISAGDRLFLFTDGLTEASDANNQLFGRERVEQVFSTEIGLSPHDFCLRVREWVDRFTEGCPEDTVDDFTILQVKVL